MLKSLYRSEVQVEPKLTAILTKIKTLSTAKSSRFVVKKSAKKYQGNELSSFTINPLLATGTIVFDPGVRFGITAASVVIQGLTFTAKLVNGFYANDAEIEYINPGVLASLSIQVIERKIYVTLAHDGLAITSTADDVKAAIEGNTAANALVSITGAGAVPLTAESITGLSGGSSTQTYDKADIVSVNRLRSRRWAITIADSANPAA